MNDHWMRHGTRFTMIRVMKFFVTGVLALTLFGFVVMALWNWLVPPITGWHSVTFWQALGLLVLSKILFGSFHAGSHGRRHWRRRMLERWEKMTPEEREKFREGMHGFCGHYGPSAEQKL